MRTHKRFHVSKNTGKIIVPDKFFIDAADINSAPPLPIEIGRRTAAGSKGPINAAGVGKLIGVDL